jgi:hypothetical protein
MTVQWRVDQTVDRRPRVQRPFGDVTLTGTCGTGFRVSGKARRFGVNKQSSTFGATGVLRQVGCMQLRTVGPFNRYRREERRLAMAIKRYRHFRND